MVWNNMFSSPKSFVSVTCHTLSHAGSRTTHDPSQWDSDVYRGQVALVPPVRSLQSRLGNNVSHSYGVVAVRQERVWQYIKKEGYVGQAVADTLCRGMGFTHAVLNSVMNLSLSKYIYNNSYNYQLSFM